VEAALKAVVPLILASFPGVVVAIFTYYLTFLRDASQARRLIANARVLLGMEIEHNRQALDTFWRELNALGRQGAAAAEAPHDQLAAMAAGGVLGYTPPQWSFTRWERVFPQVIATLSPKDVAEIDRAYRDLRSVADLFNKLVTLSPEERQVLEGGNRFWYNRFPDIRGQTFARLAEAVGRLSSFQSPMARDIAA
jgi:hypothetical protein